MISLRRVRLEFTDDFIGQPERGLKSPAVGMILKASRALKGLGKHAGGFGRKATVTVAWSTNYPPFAAHLATTFSNLCVPRTPSFFGEQV